MYAMARERASVLTHNNNIGTCCLYCCLIMTVHIGERAPHTIRPRPCMGGKLELYTYDSISIYRFIYILCVFPLVQPMYDDGVVQQACLVTAQFQYGVKCQMHIQLDDWNTVFRASDSVCFVLKFIRNNTAVTQFFLQSIDRKQAKHERRRRRTTKK